MECPVCLEDIQTDVVNLTCSHKLCKQCHDTWTKQSNACPLCKAMIQNPEEASEGCMARLRASLSEAQQSLTKLKSVTGTIPDARRESIKFMLDQLIHVAENADIHVSLPRVITHRMNINVMQDQFPDIGRDIMSMMVASLADSFPGLTGNVLFSRCTP